jgi:hypothetical protein
LVLTKNLSSDTNLNLGLFDVSGSLDFFSNNDTADSSFFKQENKVEVVTLDSLFVLYSIQNCKLLKLEAEGAEPEILLGALKSLPFIEYISVDCGPERGQDSQKTISEVTEILVMNGFILKEINSIRTILLFRNKRYIVIN